MGALELCSPSCRSWMWVPDFCPGLHPLTGISFLQVLLFLRTPGVRILSSHCCVLSRAAVTAELSVPKPWKAREVSSQSLAQLHGFGNCSFYSEHRFSLPTYTLKLQMLSASLRAQSDTTTLWGGQDSL